MSKNEIFFKAVADAVEDFLKQNNLFSADILADQIKEVSIEDPDEWDPVFEDVKSSDVLKATEEFPSIFKYYGDRIGLKKYEKDFWLNEIMKILDEENRPIDVVELISSLINKYQDKFAINLTNNTEKFKDIRNLIEETTASFDLFFIREYETESNVLSKQLLNDSVRVLKTIRKRPPPVPLQDEIIEILKESSEKLNTNRLCYRINDRKKHYKKDMKEITQEELREKLKEYKGNIKVDDNGFIEIVKK